MEVVYAWLDVFKVDRAPKVDARDAWIGVLGPVVCVRTIDCSAGTISVFVTAVSCFMKFHKMGSSHRCEFFSALLTGILRWLGVSKHKKPAVMD